jgi:hypothetical protein
MLEHLEKTKRRERGANLLCLVGFSHNNLRLFLGAPLSPLTTHSPVFFSPVSYACLATLRVDFFKVLRIQQLDLRNGNIRSLTCSVGVAEVTQVNIFSVSPIHVPDSSGS